jgi:ferredoxin
MGHQPHHRAYRDLQARLDQLPQSFPDTEEGMAILRLLFTEEEARIVARMPLRLEPAPEIARRAGIEAARAEEVLARLADRGLVLDVYSQKRDLMLYCIAPPVVGFFEFSLMRKRSDLDQGALARAFEAYEESGRTFGDTLFTAETQLGRALVHEAALDPDDVSELLPYERAGEIVATAHEIAVSYCYCRHEAEHLGRSCKAPLENCLSLNVGAAFVLRHHHGRRVERAEAAEILDRSREAGLVFIADNVQRAVGYICSCCGCCCGQLRAINRHGFEGAVKTSAFLARVEAERCTGCGKCARACPVQAIAVRARPQHSRGKKPMFGAVDEEVCLGCGVCKPVCTKGALSMAPREQRTLTPESTLARVVAMALERDRLQNLLFDDEKGLHLRFLNRLSGAILKLSPVKRALVSEKLKSRFVAFLIAHSGPVPSSLQ